ncbi:TVP38/TMEM64 family protein [Oceanirhabdus sp. W0125-5]|uniref:TVP38/TMEM64 family protein n=1 Tax=Oceanirhabdus sp. W0125-5 TaxID=2999116 RepID=UPI0022F2F7B5|nr:TVP38/TMEM64 family protein [Oceanirhabdus sp. W0125-5]WBW97369.1 TVP38/TMEM64 family protein [Oceanirhabdus sp. W0125-5]
MKALRNLIMTIAVIFVLFLLYRFIEPFHIFINSMAKALTSGNIEEVKGYIKSYGVWAPVISFLAMILQSLAAPIPAFLITFSNAAIFGWLWGAVLSWSSSMAGAAICFLLARGFGRVFVEKMNGNGAVKDMEKFFEKHGKYAILIARLLPFVSFDIVSYVAGITSMSFWSFFIATGIGQLPATIIYSIAGNFLVGGMKYFVIGLSLIFALSVLIYWSKKMYNEKQEALKDSE